MKIRMQVIRSYDLEPGMQDVDVTKYSRHDVVITPDLARRIVDLGGNPRKLSGSRVEFFLCELKSGTFHSQTVDTIGVSSDAKNLNGQHRLSAIAKSGISVEMPITTGIGDGSKKSMDRGWRRALANCIEFPTDKHAKLYSGTMGAWTLLRDRFSGGANGVTVSRAEAFNEIFGGLAVSVWSSIVNGSMIRSATAYAALEFAATDEHLAKNFVQSFTNIDDHSNHWADKLRDSLVRSPLGGGSGDSHELFRRSIYCMAKYKMGERIASVRPRNSGVWFEWPWVERVNEFICRINID